MSGSYPYIGKFANTKIALALGAALVFSTSAIYWFSVREPSMAVRWDVEIDVEPLSVETVENAFANIGYSLTGVREGQKGVARVLVKSVPDDLGQVPEVSRRKDLFIGSVLPLALAVNEQISFERREVEHIHGKLVAGKPLSGSESSELERLARVYRIIGDEDTGLAELDERALADELLLRVAPLPVSLVLAQAAEESAWGLSRFASEGNALYGQWVWNDDIGIVPKDRPAGQTHSVRAFRDVYESTLSYAHNLNTHRAYSGFRNKRAEMLSRGENLDGFVLAGTLTRYSGRGDAYIESLRTIIRGNNLGVLDRAQFIDRMGTQSVELKVPANGRG